MISEAFWATATAGNAIAIAKPTHARATSQLFMTPLPF
jgi:hypothetical protein